MRSLEDWEVFQDSLAHVGRMLSKDSQGLAWQRIMEDPKGKADAIIDKGENTWWVIPVIT